MNNAHTLPRHADSDSVKAMLSSNSARIGEDGSLDLDGRFSRALDGNIYAGTPLSYGSSLITRKGQTLSFEMLRNIYERSSAVRPPVDFIVNTLSTTPFRISVMEGTKVPKRDLKIAQELFTLPMGIGGNLTFRSLTAQLLRDLIILDHGIILKHFGKKGLIEKMEAMDSATFYPVAGKDGRLQSWLQEYEVATPAAKFSNDEVAFFRRGARTDSIFGQPIIETILYEVQSLLNASRSFAAALDKNEIPPGILFLSGVSSPRQIDRMQDKLRQDAGVANRYKMRVLSGVQDAKWISLDRTNREMEVAQLVEKVEAIVFRNLGVDRIAMNSASDINRSTAEQIVVTRNQSLIKPILDLLADKFTYEVLRYINPGLYIEFFYYARTGDQADLVSEEESETTSTGPTTASSFKPKKACHTCAGKGILTYKVKGDTDGVACAACSGRGYIGPTIVSRPTMFRRTDQELQDPVIAMEYLRDILPMDDFRFRVEQTRRNVEAILDSVDDRDSALLAAKSMKNVIGKALNDSYQMAASRVRAAGYSPSQAGLHRAEARLADFVTYHIELADKGLVSESSKAKALDEANAILDMAEHVAGSALSEYARVKFKI